MTRPDNPPRAVTEHRTRSDLSAGNDALRRGAWEEAREAFARAGRLRESPEALEGLGWAHWWLDDPDRSLELRVRAYELRIRRGDRRRAARGAISLAVDFADARGENAVAAGWLERARGLLRGLPTGAEHGWLALWEGHVARVVNGDLETARRRAARAESLGRRLNLVDLELLARALDGLVLVAEGQIEDGMRRLDGATAAAVSGEMTDLDAVGQTCCFLIHACEKTRDYDRAVQWNARMRDFCERWRVRPLHSVCRTYYASVLAWRGDLAGAEAELLAARDLATTRPVMDRAVTARLGELRRRQGRDVEADALFAQVPEHPLALLGKAALALDRGDAASAATLVDRFLMKTPPSEAMDRAAGLDLRSRVRLSQSDPEGAAADAAELRTLASRFPSLSLRALARLVEGRLAAAAGRPSEALAPLTEAVALFEESQGPFEAARARLQLAQALAAASRGDEARTVAEAARASFERLDAAHELRKVEAFLREGAARRGGKPDVRLTPRERDVLRLVADGLPDRAIAERLGVSEHTIHRHVANVLVRLGVPSRTAATALALKAGLI